MIINKFSEKKMNLKLNSRMQLLILFGLAAGLVLMPATTWTLTMVSDRVEDGTAVNNTLRQIFAAIGSSIVVVIVAVLAGGAIDHNATSVVAFNQTSLILLALHVVMLILTIVYIDDKDKIESA